MQKWFIEKFNLFVYVLLSLIFCANYPDWIDFEFLDAESEDGKEIYFKEISHPREHGSFFLGGGGRGRVGVSTEKMAKRDARSFRLLVIHG